MSGSKSSGSSESKSQSYTPEQKKWLGTALSTYGPQLGGGENVYGGQRVADFSPLQNASLQQAQGFLGQFSPDRGMPLFGQTGTALQDILSGNTGADLLSMGQANQSFEQQYANPAYRNFTQNTSPLIQEQFAGPGFWSSARAGAVGDAASDLGSQLESQRAGYLWDTEQANRQIQEAQAGRQQAGVNQAMQYGMLPTQQALAGLQGTQSAYGMGQQQQQQEQQQINADIQQFAEQNRITSQEDMAILLSLLGMNYSTSSGSSSQSSIGFGLS